MGRYGLYCGQAHIALFCVLREAHKLPQSVQLREIKYIDVKGEQKKFLPGDWVTVGRGIAERWCAEGTAWQPTKEISAPSNAGIWVRGFANPGCKILEALPFIDDPATDFAPFPLTMIWKPELGFRPELIAPAFDKLTQWQVTIPLFSYSILAKDIGTDQDRQETVKVIRSLDTPFYDDRVLFVRRTRVVNDFITDWLTGEGDSRLSLLRSLYIHKPLIYALPVSWGGGTE